MEKNISLALGFELTTFWLSSAWTRQLLCPNAASTIFELFCHSSFQNLSMQPRICEQSFTKAGFWTHDFLLCRPLAPKSFQQVSESAVSMILMVNSWQDGHWGNFDFFVSKYLFWVQLLQNVFEEVFLLNPCLLSLLRLKLHGLAFVYIEKSVVLHLPEGPELRTHHW